MSRSVTAQVLGVDFTCRVCANSTFVTRSIQLNTAGAEFFDFAWANKASTGLICDACGHLDEFVGDALVLYDT